MGEVTWKYELGSIVTTNVVGLTVIEETTALEARDVQRITSKEIETLVLRMALLD